MCLKGVKYRFLASFHCEKTFSGKTKALHLWILCRNSTFFKTHKILCTTPKRVTKTKYGPHGDELRIFGFFRCEQTFFDKTKG
jgi:hypothetical protein